MLIKTSVFIAFVISCLATTAEAEQAETDVSPPTGVGVPLMGSAQAIGLSQEANILARSLHIATDIEKLQSLSHDAGGLASQVALLRMESRATRRILAAYLELNDALSKIADEMLDISQRQQALQARTPGYTLLASKAASVGTRAVGLAGSMASPMAMSGAVASMVMTGVTSVSAHGFKRAGQGESAGGAIAPSMVAPLFAYAGSKPERYATFILTYLDAQTDGNRESKKDSLLRGWKALSNKDQKPCSTEEWAKILGLNVPLTALSSLELAKRENMLADLRDALTPINNNLRELSEAF